MGFVMGPLLLMMIPIKLARPFSAECKTRWPIRGSENVRCVTQTQAEFHLTALGSRYKFPPFGAHKHTLLGATVRGRMRSRLAQVGCFI